MYAKPPAPTIAATAPIGMSASFRRAFLRDGLSSEFKRHQLNKKVFSRISVNLNILDHI